MSAKISASMPFRPTEAVSFFRRDEGGFVFQYMDGDGHVLRTVIGPGDAFCGLSYEALISSKRQGGLLDLDAEGKASIRPVTAQGKNCAP